MRNRGYVWRYFGLYGRLNRFGFGVGTALTFAKELVRLVMVERSPRGLAELARGLRDAKALRDDPDWQPMPPLPAGRA
jgi:hypothetical protein